MGISAIAVALLSIFSGFTCTRLGRRSLEFVSIVVNKLFSGGLARLSGSPPIALLFFLLGSGSYKL